MRIAVLGTGYVGLVAGAGFSEFGNEVTCADVDAGKIAALQRGELPIYERGLADLVARNVRKRRLSFTAEPAAAVRDAEIVFIAVGTPSTPEGDADLTAVLAAAETIGRTLTCRAVVATKSTVPVGTTDRLRELVAKHAAHPFAAISNPEFLKEGDAINDFMKPDRVVIGAEEQWAREVMARLYAPFLRTRDRLQFMDVRSAELTKYACNALLAARISFMNELALLAERIGADIEEVRKGVGADSRIGPKFLYAGAGFGGSCFPKDLQALLYLGTREASPLEVASAALRANARQKGAFAAKIETALGPAVGKTVALWGLAFKPGTDDVREAPALVVIERLLEAGARVVAYDPAAMDNIRARYGNAVTLAPGMYQAVEGADALALVTEWNEFRRPDFARVKRLMRHPLLFDGRNVWAREELHAHGFTYHGIGRR